MQKHTRYLKLPFKFNTQALLKDLSLILDGKWIPHFNTSGYSGNWNAISLYANGGNDSNIFALPNSNVTPKETVILKKCLYFKEVIETFKCKVLTARILKLDVGAEIKPHRDYELGYENNNFRLHIPILTNADIQFILDGTCLTMLPGECWYTNVNYVHSVINAGKTDRVHLVLDFERNTWTDKLFFSLAPKDSFKIQPIENNDPEHIKMVLKELKNIKTPATHKLIKDLKLKLVQLTKKDSSF